VGRPIPRATSIVQSNVLGVKCLPPIKYRPRVKQAASMTLSGAFYHGGRFAICELNFRVDKNPSPPNLGPPGGAKVAKRAIPTFAARFLRRWWTKCSSAGGFKLAKMLIYTHASWVPGGGFDYFDPYVFAPHLAVSLSLGHP
jgi:hypothetical protein